MNADSSPQRKRHLLLTGASGYVGERLAARLAGMGWPVAGTYLGNPISIPGVDTLPLDLADGRAADRVIRDMRPAAVIHAAAMTSIGECERHPEEARRAILGTTLNLRDAIAARAPDTPMLLFSTDQVFDGEEAPYAEDARPKPLHRYGSLKCEAEEAVLAMPQGRVLRSALVYGPPGRHRSSFLSWMLEAMANGRELTLFEDEWRTPVWVEDLIRAVAVLLEKGGAGVYHAAGAERLSRVEAGEAFRKVFGLPGEGIRAARRATVAGAAARPKDVSLTTEALQSLGWRATPIMDGLARCREQWS